eukprot:gene13880-18613_t
MLGRSAIASAVGGPNIISPRQMQGLDVGATDTCSEWNGNERTGPFGKAVWSVLVMFVPFFGFVAWLLFGPKATKNRIG